MPSQVSSGNSKSGGVQAPSAGSKSSQTPTTFIPSLAGRKAPTGVSNNSGASSQSLKSASPGSSTIVRPPSGTGGTKVPTGSTVGKSGAASGGSSGDRFFSGPSRSSSGFTGSVKKSTAGGYFINPERSGRLNISVNRHSRDGDGRYFFRDERGRHDYCGCHRPRYECHHHRHSSYWFGFGFFDSGPCYYPVYPVYPVYTWPVYEVVAAPTYVVQPAPVVAQAPVAVPGAVAYPGQAAPGVEVLTPGAYATVPPGQQPAEQPQEQAAQPQAQPQEQPAGPTQPQPPTASSSPDTAQSGEMPVDEMDRLMKEGVEAFAAGDYEKAAQNFMRVSMAMPDNVDALLAYAVARFATGDYTNSATAIRRAVRKVPEVVNSLFDLRDRYGKMSDFDGHVANLVRYVNEKKEDIDGWLVLGFIQHFIGDRTHSKQTFEGIKQRSPADADIAEFFINAKSVEQLAKEAREAQDREQSGTTQPSAQESSSQTLPSSVGTAGSQAPTPGPVQPAAAVSSGDFSDPF